MDALTCKICLNEYDRIDFTPVNLPDCGHSLCRTCEVALRMRNPINSKCPFCKKVIMCEPVPNYALLDVIDSIQPPEELITIKIGRVPHLIDVVSLKDLYLNKFPSGKNIEKVTFEDDPHSSFFCSPEPCEEKIVTIEYKSENKNEVIKSLDGKIFSIFNEDMHLMLNVCSTENKFLHPDVKKILKAKGYDMVMLIPSRPALGYDLAIKMEFEEMAISCPWMKEIKSLVEKTSQLISCDRRIYYILHFLDQELLSDAYVKLSRYKDIKLDGKYNFLPVKNNMNILKLEMEVD
ncbi:unnamed protein product [Moneuplotes crassus]|uniref:RING-type domain-containing protein n=1 Tax=Euplotes crassus TaxID=5936 RepID=A0AAD2D1J5_EUPCR|nr:unnamed protein product [Moneuplotes crassus]